ncbi:DUF11 domain-containing protein [Nocardioides sp. J54]|uniref:DUF11 domain-containing protein n=1 Tax=Nocardioides sp. J54 TaxID=935866 RepID=UPI00048E97E4|nr:DUF11 domain-containing protein [Nocardioides sp. J54]
MNLPLRLAAVTGSLTLGALSTTSLAPAAHAAPGDPFDPARPTVFIVQGDPSQLQVAQPDAAGNFTFSDEGTAAGVQYNGISYSTADDFLYGFATADSADHPLGSLLRIGQDGVVTRVGTQTWAIDGSSFNVGAINPATGHIHATVTSDDQMYVIDPATGEQVGAPIDLPGTMVSYGEVSDWTFSQGYLWGLGANRTIVRIDPSTGALSQWTLADNRVDTGFTGAAWTYVDGTLGFSHNASGQVERIAVDQPASATPVFTVLRVGSGPSSSLNDGAASPGLPADLALAKVSSGFAPGATVTYTLSVTNNGDGWSTGWTLTDAVPDTLGDVSATSSAEDVQCSVAGNDVTCVSSGELAPGDTAEVTVTATVPEELEGSVRNSARVEGNEEDPDDSNNSAGVTDSVDEPDPTDPGADPDTDPVVVPENPSVPAGGGQAGPGDGTATAAWLVGGAVLLGAAGGVLSRRRPRGTRHS